MPKISEVFVLILIACFVSMMLELNKFGVNLERGIKRPNVIYISSAFISATCGMLTALTGILFNNQLIVWIIFDIVGTFLGRKSLKIILKILGANLAFLKNSNVLDDVIKQIDDVNKTDDDDAKEDKK